MYLPASLRVAGRTWPSLDLLWACAVITFVIVRVQLTPVLPNDFWWHLATGRMIAQSGSIPPVDQFSFTQAGTAYFNQPWLAQLLMYGVYCLGGVALLVALQGLLVGGSFMMLYRLCRQEGAGPRIAAVTTFAAALLGSTNWQIRPQSYALPLFVITLTIVLAWRRCERAPLWALPLLMVLWVNVHGTFTLLPVLCGLIWLSAVVSRWHSQSGPSWRSCGQFPVWSALAVAATVINPAGIHIWRYVIALLGNSAVQNLVTEWTSPLRQLDEPMSIIFLILIVVFVGIAIWRRQRLRLQDVLLVVPFVLLAFQATRNILWFGIVAAPIAARLLATHRAPQERREIVLINWMVGALLASALLATLPWSKQQLALPPKVGNLIADVTAVEAVAHLEAMPQRPQRLFHDLGVGSYLIWAIPEQRVFIDPRFELYPYDQWLDYIDLSQGRDIDTLAARYGIDAWLVSPEKQEDLLAALDAHPRWQRTLTTSDAVLFEPRSSTHH